MQQCTHIVQQQLQLRVATRIIAMLTQTLHGMLPAGTICMATHVFCASVDGLPSTCASGACCEQPKSCPEDCSNPLYGTACTGLTHWQSPHFYAYYPCNSSFPGMLGEMLCAGFATQNFSWIGSPAATELETVSYAAALQMDRNVRDTIQLTLL